MGEFHSILVRRPLIFILDLGYDPIVCSEDVICPPDKGRFIDNIIVLGILSKYKGVGGLEVLKVFPICRSIFLADQEFPSPCCLLLVLVAIFQDNKAINFRCGVIHPLVILNFVNE